MAVPIFRTIGWLTSTLDDCSSIAIRKGAIIRPATIWHDGRHFAPCQADSSGPRFGAVHVTVIVSLVTGRWHDMQIALSRRQLLQSGVASLAAGLAADGSVASQETSPPVSGRPFLTP